jgi:hypothetical protein
MVVLITGATGFIGGEIVKLCHKRGYTVHYLTTNKHKIQQQSNYKGFYWNPSIGEIDANCFINVTAIINLAGANIAKRWTPSYRKKIINSRVNSLQTLFKALKSIKNHNVTQLVSASAIGIYPHSYTNYYDEKETAVDASFLGDVVKQWENATQPFTKIGCKVAILRIGLVLSATQGALPTMVKPIKNLVGAPLGSGEQWQSWIHIHDLTRIFLHSVENNFEGIYNAVAPNPVTNKKLTKEIASVLNAPLWLPRVPSLILKIVLGKMSYILLASQRVNSRKIQAKGYLFKYITISGALQHLLYQE